MQRRPSPSLAASTIGANARLWSSARHVPWSVERPPTPLEAISSLTRRVLPIPGAPTITARATGPGFDAPATRARSRDNSASRPMNGATLATDVHPFDMLPDGWTSPEITGSVTARMFPGARDRTVMGPRPFVDAIRRIQRCRSGGRGAYPSHFFSLALALSATSPRPCRPRPPLRRRSSSRPRSRRPWMPRRPATRSSCLRGSITRP